MSTTRISFFRDVAFILCLLFVSDDAFSIKSISKTNTGNGKVYSLSPDINSRLTCSNLPPSKICSSALQSRLIMRASQSSSYDAGDDSSVERFVSEVQSSLASESFLSFALSGPQLAKTRKKTKKKSGAKRENENEKIVSATNKEDRKQLLRGCIKSVTGRLVLLKKKGKNTGKKRTARKNVKNNDSEEDTNHSIDPQNEQLYVQAMVKYHGATDVAHNWKVESNKSIEVEQGLLSLLSGKTMGSEWKEGVQQHLGIQKGELQTTEGTWTLMLSSRSNSDHSWECRFKKSSAKEQKQQKQVLAHDRTKNVPLSPNADFFQKLGVTNMEGKPRPGMKSKLRQCQRFVEIVGGLVESSISKTAPAKKLSMVDMGCGRGYLTFALHAFLMDEYGGGNMEVESRGIEMRPKLVKEIDGIARTLGDQFDTLRFVEGTVDNYRLDGQHATDPLDVLIALHACDTATDDSLWYGIGKSASVIVTAPCCHKEVRKELDPYVAKVRKDDHPYQDIFRHPIYRERMAETVTDSMRALLLEIANYDVRVFEFIGGEHTSKNVMIAATKRKRDRTDAEKDELKSRLKSLAGLHGVSNQKLAFWMGEPLGDVDNGDDEGVRTKILRSRKMPPLS